MSFSFGTSDKNTTANQTSSTATNPYAATVPSLTTLLAQLSPNINGAGSLNPTQSTAISDLESKAANPWAPQVADAANAAFGVQSGAPQVEDAYSTLKSQLTPYADGSNTDISTNPQVQQLLATIKAQVGDSVNQEFAGAGRDMSGINQKDLALGISQGEATPLLNLFTTEQGNQINAAGTLNNAGVAAASAGQGLDTAAAQEQAAGAGVAQDAVTANQQGDVSTLTDEATKLGIPVQQLQQIASVLFPAAGLGSTTTGSTSGTSNTNTTSAGVSTNAPQIGNILQSIGAMFSDIRLKRDVRRIGSLPSGLPAYRFKYLSGDREHIGVMAHEASLMFPGAVSMHASGFLVVDYSKIC